MSQIKGKFVIGLRAIVAAARLAVERMKPWHVYVNPTVGATSGCRYTTRTIETNGVVKVGCVRCYVGEIMEILGYPIDQWQDLDKAGSSVDGLIRGIEEDTADNPFYADITFTAAAVAFLEKSQSSQDNSTPWGKAFNRGLVQVKLAMLVDEDEMNLDTHSIGDPLVVGFTDEQCVKPQAVKDAEAEEALEKLQARETHELEERQRYRRLEVESGETA